MDPERELILHIDPDSATIKVESRSPEGSIITKRIGYNALVDCIKGSLQREMICCPPAVFPTTPEARAGGM